MSSAAAAADVCDTYYTTSRRLPRCDTGPTKYTVADDPRQHACLHQFTDTNCSPASPLTLKSSTSGVIGQPNSLAASLTARYLDQ